MPLRYPVHWADTPEEVPEWDASRQPHIWVSENGWQSAKVQNDSVRDAPATGYPRLVCSEPKPSEDDQVFINERPAELLNRLLAIHAYLPAWHAGKPVKRLRNHVLALANSCGAPFGRENNTLEAWLCLAAIVHACMWTYKLLASQEYEGMQAALNDKVEPILREDGVFPKEKPPFFHDYDGTGHGPEEMELGMLWFLRFWAVIFERGEQDTPNYRLEVASRLYGMFCTSFDGTKAKLVLSSDGIYAECPTAVWAVYRLSQLWRNGAEVRVCPVCGTLFAPARRNVKYCDLGACAFKAHKQNQKARAARGEP